MICRHFVITKFNFQLLKMHSVRRFLDNKKDLRTKTMLNLISEIEHATTQNHEPL